MDREWNQNPEARFLSVLLFPWLWRALALDRAARQENDEQLDQAYLLLIENFMEAPAIAAFFFFLSFWFFSSD